MIGPYLHWYRSHWSIINVIGGRKVYRGAVQKGG